MNRHIITLLIATIALPLSGAAHGVAHHISHKAVVVTATYSDGAPMAFCDAAVFSPSDPDTPYQEGSTDPEGRVAFVPNTNGMWRVRVDDGMGHVMTTPVNALALHPDRDSDAHVPAISRPLGFAIGLSLIFGLFGVYTLARQASGNARPKHGCGGEECECTSPKA